MIDFLLHYAPNVVLMNVIIAIGMILIKPKGTEWAHWVIRILCYIAGATVFYYSLMGPAYFGGPL